MTTLYCKVGNRYLTAEPSIVCEVAASYIAEPLRRGGVLSNPKGVRDYLRTLLAPMEREAFVVLFLDTRHRLIAAETLFLGTVDGATVHPREIVKRVLHHNAVAIILAHNHPSGVPEPSSADELITQRIRDAVSLIDSRVLDHLIVSREAIVSFAERGLL